MSTAVQPLPGQLPPAAEGRTRRAARSSLYYVPAVVVFAAGIVAWEILVEVGGLQRFVLPKPSSIVSALLGNWTGGRFDLFASARATLVEALGGLAIGTLAGVAVAFAASRWLSARSFLLPLAVAANAIPIIAFAPLLNNWFGALSPLSKMMMAAVLVFFPVMANVSRGLTQVEPAALELMRSLAASEWTVLRKVRIPNALPFFFTAMRLATTLSLIGAIVGEYFGGASLVLGRIIVQSLFALRFDVTWAAILLSALIGIAFYLVVVALERAVMPWHSSLRVA